MLATAILATIDRLLGCVVDTTEIVSSDATARTATQAAQANLRILAERIRELEGDKR